MAKTEKRKNSDRTPEPARAEDRADQASEAPERVLGERVTVQLTEEGQIDWERMQAKTRAKLERAGVGPGGVQTAPQTAPAAPGLDPNVAGMLWGGIGSLLVGAASWMGYPKDEALKMQFTPDERAALVEPTNAVLAKYSVSLGEYEEEIMLALAVGTLTYSKFTAMKKPATVTPLREVKRPDPVAHPSDTGIDLQVDS